MQSPSSAEHTKRKFTSNQGGSVSLCKGGRLLIAAGLPQKEPVDKMRIKKASFFLARGQISEGDRLV